MPVPDTETHAQHGPMRPAWRGLLLLYWITLALLTHWPSLSVVETPYLKPDNPYRLLQQDKPVHMIAFGALATLLILARPFGKHRTAQATALIAAAVALVYAVIDETTQGFFADRTVSHSDLLANFLGITGVLLLALTPRLDPQATQWINWRSATRLVTYLGAFALGCALLAITRMFGRETYVIHTAAAAWITIALLRGVPLVPRSPRLSALLVCGAVAATVALGEIAQGFSGMAFSQNEVLFGEIGLLAAMGLWSARLALAGDAAQVQPPLSADAPAAHAVAEDGAEFDHEPDAVPAPSSRA